MVYYFLKGVYHLVFRAKRDRFFIGFISIASIILLLSFLLPILFDPTLQLQDLMILAVVLFSVIGLLWWSTFSIQYTFLEDMLYVKGGPFRSKIPYHTITSIYGTKNIWTGYRILSSKEAIEILNSKTILGSIKISPEHLEAFLQELEKRAPQVQIQNDLKKD